MKIRNLVKGVFATIATVCVALGFSHVTLQASADEVQFTDVDITETLQIKRIENTAGKNYIEFFVNAGETVGAYVKGKINTDTWPGGGVRWVLNKDSEEDVALAGCDLLSYVEVNGKSVRSIMAEVGNSYGSFDKNDVAFDVYTPVMINAEGLFTEGFHVVISKQYILDVNNGQLDGFEFTLKNGIVWNNVLQHSLKTTEDVTFAYYKGAFITDENAQNIKPTIETNINETTNITMVKKDMENRSQFVIDFGEELENILPILEIPQVAKDGGFYVNDHPTDYGTDVDLMEYILLNGRTLRSIVKENSQTFTYKGSSYPMSFGGMFAPIAVFVGEKQVSIDILNEYCVWQDVRLTLKKGFMWTVKGTEINNYLLTLTEDITYGIKDGLLVKFDRNYIVNVDQNLRVKSAVDSGDYKCYTISMKETFSDSAKDMTQQWANIVEINGETIEQINTNSKGAAKIEWAFTNGKTTIEILLKKNFVAKTPVNSITLNPFELEFNSVHYALQKEVEFGHSEGVFKRVCIVTFDGGEKIKVLEGEMLPIDKIPTTPTKENTDEKLYAFQGWYYQYLDGQEYIFEIDKFVVLSDMDLYSKYIEENKKYKVTFLNESGTVIAEREIPHGDKIILQDIPVKEHYTGNWVYQGTEELTVMPKVDITYKVQYTPTEYTITFYKNEIGTEILARETYTIEDKEITVPTVLEKVGFDGEWATYELNGGNVEVRPVYKANGSPDNGCKSSLSSVTVVGAILSFCFIFKKKQRNIV